MIVMGAHNNNWNVDLEAGYMNLIVDLLLAGSGFFVLCLCLGEMSSTLPFSGGIYGFARATSGPYYGFITASFELLFHVAYNCALIVPLMNIPLYTEGVSETFHIWMILIIYGSIFFILLIGGKPFWTLTSIIAVSSLLITVIYLAGSAANPNASFYEHCMIHGSKVLKPMSVASVMIGRPPAASQFIGIQYLPLASEYLQTPRKQIPKLLMICCTIFFASFLFVSLAACSQPPGIEKLSTMSELLAPGFQQIFGISYDKAVWIGVPSMFGSALAFIFSYSRQLYAISSSGLLPEIFSRTLPVLETPYISLFLGCLICLLLNLYGYYYPVVIEVLSTVGFLSFQITALNIFIIYIIMATQFSNLERKFTSPLGIAGAVYGFLNFCQAIVSMTVYKGDQKIGIVFIALWFVLSSLMYVFYVRNHQKLSEEEQKSLLKAYMIQKTLPLTNAVKKVNQILPLMAKHTSTSVTTTLQQTNITSTDDDQTSDSSGSRKHLLKSPLKLLPFFNSIYPLKDNGNNLPEHVSEDEWQVHEPAEEEKDSFNFADGKNSNRILILKHVLIRFSSSLSGPVMRAFFGNHFPQEQNETFQYERQESTIMSEKINSDENNNYNNRTEIRTVELISQYPVLSLLSYKQPILQANSSAVCDNNCDDDDNEGHHHQYNRLPSLSMMAMASNETESIPGSIALTPRSISFSKLYVEEEFAPPV
jgi:ethanolamine permease